MTYYTYVYNNNDNDNDNGDNSRRSPRTVRTIAARALNNRIRRGLFRTLGRLNGVFRSGFITRLPTYSYTRIVNVREYIIRTGFPHTFANENMTVLINTDRFKTRF